MKKRFAGIVLILLLVFCFCIANAASNEKHSGLFTYQLKGNGTAIITKFHWDGSNSDVYIPNLIDGYSVTEIGERAFSFDPALPSYTKQAVNAIQNYKDSTSFAVVLPDTIKTIREKAFFCSRINHINIPVSVEVIESGALAGCIYISQFNVDSGNSTFATIDGVLYNKKTKTLVAYPMRKNGEFPYVASEGYNLLWGGEVKERGKKPNTDLFSIPNGIVAIGDYAFYGVALAGVNGKITGVEIPSTVQSIGVSAFEGAIIGSTNGNVVYNSSRSKYETDELRYLPENAAYKDCVFSLSNVKYIGDKAFEKTIFRNAEIDFSHSQIETIGDFAFYKSEIYFATKEAHNLVFPSSLAKIGESSFSYMNFWHLAKIDLSNTQLSEIATNAFMGINNKFNEHNRLRIPIEISLPSSIECIEENAFNGSLVTIDLTNNINLKTIKTGAFCNSTINSDSQTFILPANLIEIGDQVFYCDGINLLSIPSSVTSIGQDICPREKITIQAERDSYAAFYAKENGIPLIYPEEEDTSWLNN